MSADQLLAAAQGAAGNDGLRGAVSAYMDAVDALVAEKRIGQAQSVMIDLLKAQEKKKGLFGRVDKNPLGTERVTVGLKFAEVSRVAPPTEEALDQLGYLAIDFPDETVIRRANADALRQAGYAADAIDEYRFCAGASPDDADVHQRIADLYVGIGRPDDAAGYLVRALQLYARQGDFERLAGHAESLLELRPASLGDLIDLLSTAPGKALIGHTAMLEELAHRVMHAAILDADQRAKACDQLQALYERLLVASPGDGDAKLALEQLKDVAAPASRDVAALAKPVVAEPQPSQPEPVAQAKPQPAPVAQPKAPPEPAPPVAQSPAKPPEPEPAPVAQPEPAPALVERAAPPPDAAVEPARRQPAAPNALAAYTRRKAKELFDKGDLQGAVMCYERLLRSGPDIETLEGVLECYIGMGRTQDALRVGVELVNEKADAGDLEGALASVDRVLSVSQDANFAERRMELLVALGRPEAVGR